MGEMMEFQQAATALFRHMGIDLPQESRDEVYSVSVGGKLVVKLFAGPEGYLNTVALLGKVPDASASAAMATLLNFNCFTPVQPDFNFKVGVNAATRGIELWMRRSLHDTDGDELIDLFRFTVETAKYLKQLVEQAPAREKSRSRVARLSGPAASQK
jgi:hypothetical protein